MPTNHTPEDRTIAAARAALAAADSATGDESVQVQRAIAHALISIAESLDNVARKGITVDT